MAVKRTRLARGTLSRDGIADAALALIGRGGAGALTIRALARELGADPTAVYRHFRDKDELLGVVGDRLLARVRVPVAGAGWRGALEQIAADLHAVLATDGGIDLFARSPYTPAVTTLVDRTVGVLVEEGLDPPLAGDALRSTVTLVFGHAAQTGGGDESFWAELVGAARPPARFPTIHEQASGWTDAPGDQFERELSLLLDGIAARHAGG